MIEASSGYPLLDATWTIFIFFAWVIWFWLLITVFADVFRRSDISGWGKAGWCVFVLVLPFLGVFWYLIAQSKGMADRNIAQAQASKAQYDEYVRSVASTGNSAEQIAKAKQLLDEGTIDQAEFDALKHKALAA